MLKMLIAAGALLAATAATAAPITAYWTGGQEQVWTVTYQVAWRCEYNANMQRVYRLFKDSCPMTILVE